MSDETEIEEKTIPYDRFAKKVTEVKALKNTLAEAMAELEGLRENAGKLEETTKALAELQATYEADKASYTTSLELSRSGITDEDQAELVRWRFAKSGKTTEEFGEWLKNDAPGDKLLAGFFNSAPNEAPEAPAQPARNVEPPPPVNNGTRAAPAPRTAYSAENVANMSVDELRQNYNSIMETWGFPGHDFSKP